MTMMPIVGRCRFCGDKHEEITEAAECAARWLEEQKALRFEGRDYLTGPAPSPQYKATELPPIATLPAGEPFYVADRDSSTWSWD